MTSHLSWIFEKRSSCYTTLRSSSQILKTCVLNLDQLKQREVISNI